MTIVTNIGDEYRISEGAAEQSMRGKRVRVVRVYALGGKHYGLAPGHGEKRSLRPAPDSEPSYEVELLEDAEPHAAGTLIWAKGEELE